MTKLILTSLAPYFYEAYSESVKKFFTLLRNLKDHRGLLSTVKYIKKLRLVVTRFLSGEPLLRLEGIKIYKNGWPKALREFYSITKTSNAEYMRSLLTLLTVLRNLEFKPDPDITPIISPYKGDITGISDRHIDKALKELHIEEKEVKWKYFHMSSKRGPNGHALLSSVGELNGLPEQLRKDVISLANSPEFEQHIHEILNPPPEILNNKNLLEVYSEAYYKKPPLKTYELRKLSYFSDKEGKTRIVGILDYWSQTALRPLHDTLMNMLSHIYNDCTFRQGHFLEVLPPRATYYSFDLSNATDRMPITLQQKIIGKIIGPDRADAWKRVMTDHPFLYKSMKNGKVTAEYIKYEAGQPMGGYSSWAAMALCHHLIIRICAFRAGISHFKDYVVLGDDVVIANDDVAHQYVLMCTELDIPISPMKTHKSKSIYEFAKRWIYNGVEISPFSVGGLTSTWNHYALLSNFLTTQSDHGWWRFDECSLDHTIRRCNPVQKKIVTGLYAIKGKPQEGNRVWSKFELFRELYQINEGREPQGVLVTAALQSYRGTFLPESRFGPYHQFITEDYARIEKLLYHQVISQELMKDLMVMQGDLYQHWMDIQKATNDIIGLDIGGGGAQSPYFDWSVQHIPSLRLLRETDGGEDIDELVMLVTDPDVAVTQLQTWLSAKSLTTGLHHFEDREVIRRVNRTARMIKSFLETLGNFSKLDCHDHETFMILAHANLPFRW